MNFNKDLIKDIQNKNDIVDIISNHIALTKRGNNYWGLCPFHDDSNPSLSVSGSKQIFKCFSCGEGGSVITFVMKYLNVNFIQALSMLAQKVGSLIEDIDPTIQRHLDLLQQMSDFYFKEGCNKDLSHLTSLSQSTINDFSVGYAPMSYDISDKVSALELGFINEDKSLYFRNRVIFPYFNSLGQVVGFHGRISNWKQEDKTPKQLCGKNTLLFNRSKILYGLNKTIVNIKAIGFAYLVEGQKDFLQLYDKGIKNVVCSSGTNVSNFQINLLSKITRTVNIFFDGDEGGRKASLEVAKALLNKSVIVQVCPTPDLMDPADIIISQGLPGIPDPVSVIHFLIRNREIEYNSKFEMINSVVKFLEGITNDLYKKLLIEEAASLMEIETHSLEKALKNNSIQSMITVKKLSPYSVEPWQQLLSGLFYLPQYSKKVLDFLNIIEIPEELYNTLNFVIKNNIETPQDWATYTAANQLLLPPTSPILEEMDENDIKNLIVVATKALVAQILTRKIQQCLINGSLATEDLRDQLRSLDKNLLKLD